MNTRLHPISLMLSFLVLMFIGVCMTLLPLAAQITDLDRKIIIFDKLSKTIITFSAKSKPSVEFLHSSNANQKLHVRYSLNMQGAQGTLTLDEPVPAGKYRIRFISYNDTAETMLTVLPSELPKTLDSRKRTRFFGERLALNLKLPPEAELPLNQFYIDYHLFGMPPVFNRPFSESWMGPRIPAYTTSGTYSVIWFYPPTGERVPLLTHQFTPVQQPAKIWGKHKVAVQLRSISETYPLRQLPTTTLDLVVQGLSLDTSVPIDVDNNGEWADYSSHHDVSLDSVMIEFAASSTKLGIYNGDEPDTFAQWSLSSENLRLLEKKRHPDQDSIELVLQVDLPALRTNQSRILRGSVLVRIQTTLTNSRNGQKAINSEYISVPIEIPYQGLAAPNNQQQASETGKTPVSHPEIKRIPAEPICKECFSAPNKKTSSSSKAGNSAQRYKTHSWKLTDPALIERVQRFFLAAGFPLRKEALVPNAPVVLHGKPIAGGRYSILSIRLGGFIATALIINEFMPANLNNQLSRPIEQIEGKQYKSYQYTVLSRQEQIKEIHLHTDGAYRQGDVQTREALRRLDNYAAAGFAMFKADTAVMERLREAITPGLPRTPALETAEAECSKTDEIKRRIVKREPIPQSLLEDGGSPQDCETVKNYYTAFAGLVRIGEVYLVVNMRGTKQGKEPEIIGTVCTQSASLTQAADPSFLINALQNPIPSARLSADDLREFKTKEYEKDEAGTIVPVRGSMLQTRLETLYDYCMQALRLKQFEDITDKVMLLPTQTESFSEHSVPALPTSTKPLPPTSAHSQEPMISGIDYNAYAQILTMWTLCDASLEQQIRAVIHKVSPSGSALSRQAPKQIVLWGRRVEEGYKGQIRGVYCDGVWMPFAELQQTFSPDLLNVLAYPVTAKADGQYSWEYCHRMLPLQEELHFAARIDSLQRLQRLSVKNVLSNLPNYTEVPFALIEADGLLTRRIREVFTPTPDRSSFIEEAMNACEEKYEISRRVELGAPLPKDYMDKLSNPDACEEVRKYYETNGQYKGIGRLFIVLEKCTARNEHGQQIQPQRRILGLVGIGLPTSGPSYEPKFMINALRQPILVKEAHEIDTLKTKEFERDEETGVMLAVRGSIESTGFATLKEYIQAWVQQNRYWSDKSSLLRPQR